MANQNKHPVSEYFIPLQIRIAREVLRAIFRFIFHLISRVVVSGLENVPKSGAYLIATNHISLFDSPLVVSFWPMSPEVAGASDVWDRPGQSLLVQWYGGIPVHRGQFDRNLIDTALQALKSGYPLLIAPEGGRSHSLGMRQANPGVAYFIDKAKVPVVPVGVVGSTDDFLARGLRLKRPTIEMHVGKPIVLPAISGKGSIRREMRQKNADFVMAHIATLLPEDYRGFYADHELLTSQTPE
jgi:1-acyl-sn-glycerol-3-phosphate acyltransferase